MVQTFRTASGRSSADEVAVSATQSDQLPKKRRKPSIQSIARFTRRGQFSSASSLCFVSGSVMVTLVIMLAVQLAARSIWATCTPGKPCKWAKTQQDIFTDVMYTRVPRIKEYAKGHDFSHVGEARAPGLYAPTRDCVQPFVSALKSRLGEMRSQPEFVHEIYKYMRLENSTTGRRVVDDLWETSQAYEPVLDQVANCTRQNRPLHEVLCAWLDDPSIAAELVTTPSDPDNADALRFAVHEVLVLDRFALEAARSKKFRAFMASHMAAMNDEVESAIVKVSREQGESEDIIQFKLEKWNSLFTPNQEMLLLDLDGGMPSKAAGYLHKQLMLNVLEATDIDRSIGVAENADIGITLAASAATAIPYMEDHNVIFDFTKEWFDAYNVWNLNYVTNFMNLHVMAKLLNPSILCTSDEYVRDHWMTSRTTTLKSMYLTRFLESATRRAKQRVLWLPASRRKASARIAARHLDLKQPAHCCGFGTLYEMWEKLKPYPLELQLGSSQLRSEWFQVYFLLIAWLSVVLAGLGSEIVVGPVIARRLMATPDGFIAWHFSQLVFSLLLTIAFTAHDGIGLFFLAAGLWKMGFPETIAALIGFKKAPQKLLHHLSTSLVITAICLHVFPRDRALTAGCIVPILQHLFALVKYHARWTFTVLELLLEVWFQMEVICNVAEFDSRISLDITNLGRGLALSMLLAHYLYLLAAGLKLVTDICLPSPGPAARSTGPISSRSSMHQMALTVPTPKRSAAVKAQGKSRLSMRDRLTLPNRERQTARQEWASDLQQIERFSSGYSREAAPRPVPDDENPPKLGQNTSCFIPEGRGSAETDVVDEASTTV